MSRNFSSYKILSADEMSDLTRWADTVETSLAVAVALRSVESDGRDYAQIWDSPTPAEIDSVKMAIKEYIALGDFDAQERYFWGCESFSLT